MASIVAEIKKLVDEQGVREVVLLGQNVNGFHDTSPESALAYPSQTGYMATPGFSNLYNSKAKEKPGARFVDLLIAVSDIHPELRVRFTSPHPKDFPTSLLEVIAARKNICASLHLPVQSGSTTTLARMRRGYSRESFLDLVARARSLIPGVTLSTDVIAGFCGETEEEHRDTVSLMAAVGFDQAFMFAYSLREKTHAAHVMEDNIPETIKLRRLQEIIDVQYANVHHKNVADELGQYRLILVEGLAKKSTTEQPWLTGRTDGNKRVLFPLGPRIFSAHSSYSSQRASSAALNGRLAEVYQSLVGNTGSSGSAKDHSDLLRALSDFSSALEDTGVDGEAISTGISAESLFGTYVVVKVLKVNGPTLRGIAISKSSIAAFDG